MDPLSPPLPPTAPPPEPAGAPQPRERSPLLPFVWAALLLAVVAFMVMQRLPQPEATAAQFDPGRSSDIMLKLMGRQLLGFKQLLVTLSTDPRQVPTDQWVRDIRQAATTPTAEVRAATLIAELAGPEAAVEHLDRIINGRYAHAASPAGSNENHASAAEAGDSSTPDADGAATLTQAPALTQPEQRRVDHAKEQLLRDATLLRGAYADGAAALAPTDRDRLLDRYGWFAELALTNDLPAGAPARVDALRPARRAAVTLVVALAAGLIALFVGLALLVAALVMFSSGRLTSRYRLSVQPEPSAPAQSVYLETATLFLLALIALSVLAAIVESITGVALKGLLIVPSVLVPLWPLLRGVGVSRWKAGLGVHCGRGVLMEILSGLAGYLAALPIVAVLLIATMILTALLQHVFPWLEQPTHPIVGFDLRTGGQVLGLYLLAVVWAPLFEELAFRGAFHHHLRMRGRSLLATLLVTAFVFAVIHPQGLLAVPALMTLAVVFGLLREWRGSIIAPITAHAINNGVLVTVLVLVLG